MEERTESCRQEYLLFWSEKLQWQRIWWIAHFSSLQSGQADSLENPQSLSKSGVVNQLTEACKTNLINEALTFPQMRFFHERSKGSADSDQ